MPRPRKKERPRIASSISSGYAFVRAGWWHTWVGGERKATGFRATDDDGNYLNEAEVRTELDERSLEYAQKKLGRAVAAQSPPSSVTRTIHELIKEYKDAKADKTKPRQFEAFDQAMTEFFPVNFALDPADEDLLYRHIAERLSVSKVGAWTRRARLQALSRVLRFGVQRHYIPANPIDVIGVTPAPESKERKVYTAEEIDKIVTDLQSRPAMAQHARYIRLSRLTGMRGGEMQQLVLGELRKDGHHYDLSGRRLGEQDSYVSQRGIQIFGKGRRLRHFPVGVTEEMVRKARGKSETARARLAWMRSIVELLAELREQATGNGGRVFLYNNYSRPTKALAATKLRLDIPTSDGRSMRTVRTTAVFEMRTVYGLSIEKICDLVGHSIAVHLRHYRRVPTLEELLQAIERDG